MLGLSKVSALFCALLPTVAAALPAMTERDLPGDTFSLYAYDEDTIGGLPVFYSNGPYATRL